VIDDLYAAVSRLPADEWRDVILGSVAQGTYAGHRLPRVPPIEFQRRSNAATDAVGNLRVGHRIYAQVLSILDDLGRPLRPDSRVLDFGCGWGRVARFFLHDIRGEGLFGVDIDQRGIESCRESFPLGTFLVSSPWPPSGFHAETFDLVYAVSVFSHLPEGMHLAWVEEITRILRPGGVLVATTLGRDFIEGSAALRQSGKAAVPWEKAKAESFRDPHSALAAYDAGSYVYAPKPRDEYGMALIPEGYVRRRWTRWLRYERFTGRAPGFGQAVIVMTKSG
jgi:SAM-dependent methyltransferase